MLMLVLILIPQLLLIQLKRVEKELLDYLILLFFIPDGPICPSQFIETSIFFDEFLPNETFDNINDIRSICINMEHSFTGDIQIDLFCPSGQQTILKHFNHTGGTYGTTN